MTRREDARAGFDPRYNPAFQRGYDPAAPPEWHGPAPAPESRTSPGPLERAEDPDSQDPDFPDQDSPDPDSPHPDSPQPDSPRVARPAGVNPFRITLVACAIAVIAGISVLAWVSSGIIPRDPAAWQQNVTYLIWSVGPAPLLAAVLALVGLAFLAGLRWRPHPRTDLSDTDLSDTDPSDMQPPANPFSRALIVLGVVFVVAGIAANGWGASLSRSNQVGDIGALQLAMLIGALLAPALLQSGIVTLVAVTVLAAVRWRHPGAAHVLPRSSAARNPFLRGLWAASFLAVVTGPLVLWVVMSVSVQDGDQTSVILQGALSPVAVVATDVGFLTIAGLLLFRTATWRRHSTLTTSERGSARS